MLKSLEIENIAVIEKVSIDFESGFNVLTGETGAGKSIIIDSINAVLGLRTSRDLVRTGASHALVIAEFSPVSKAVEDFLYQMDIEPEPDNLILQRRIGADGKSACRINGKPVTAGTMKALGEMLVNIHGQHDSQKLLDAEKHYLYIDEQLGDSDILERYHTSYAGLVKTLKELKALKTDEQAKQRRVEQLRYEIDEIEKAAIEPGEKEKLLKEKELIHSLASLTDALQYAKLALSGDDETPGAEGLIQSALSKTEGEGDTYLGEINASLAAAADAVGRVGEEIRAKLDTLDFSPERADQIEERLGIFYAFANRYGKSEEEIAAYLENAKKELDSIVYADKRKAQLESEFEQHKEQTYRLALELSEKRRKTAEAFEKRVENELWFLNMQSAQFKVNFKDGPISKTGIDTIEFLISVNAGEALKPLSAVASGGELSRIMLAFRAVLGEKEAVPTLIFDEIDTGVSGRAAGKVGMKLKEVSKNAQVICVTHLAQIAAMASTHFLIHKQVAEGRTYTNVRPLDFEGRQYEIARIMGGMNINELMLENAKQLLKEFENDNI
ncbi:MAG: DNA repair protein RecN [Clostridia bacterium]|nr:DNA repair protein RecN [Clostridia bacterium]